MGCSDSQTSSTKPSSKTAGAGPVSYKQLLQREWIGTGFRGERNLPKVTKIRILHWNVLAQQLTGADAFPKVDEQYQTWEHRNQLFEQEFFKMEEDGSMMWDVICLQECDVHDKLFEGSSVYLGGKMPKGSKWSCAIFYNGEKFEEVEGVKIDQCYKDPETGEDQSQHCVGRILRDKKSGVEFSVVTTHLKAKAGFELMRKDQALQLGKICRSIEYPIILTGDFNDVPDSEAISAIEAANFLHTDKPEFTTSKFRESTGLQTRTIDYIFYQSKSYESKIAGIKSIYKLPSAEALPKSGYPSENHPSDHLALGCEFILYKC